MQDRHRFFRCIQDGTLVGLIHGEGTLFCCGQPMEELIANTSDAAKEKHVPQVKVNGSDVTVDVGSIHHPMSEEHSINWVYLLTQKGGQRKNLPYDGKPVAQFRITEDDQVVAAYAYCNLHGLWKTEI
jgi:superoxide reductase